MGKNTHHESDPLQEGMGEQQGTRDERQEANAVRNQDETDVGKELSELREELSAEREKNKDLYDKYLRLHADFENFKKRMEREKCEYYKFALERLFKDLLPVIDNLELAIRSAEESKNIANFSEGIQLIYKQLNDILMKEGLLYECAVGEKFDPCKHEAMMHLESHEHEPNIVVEEHKKGYFLNDRLLRPAMVTVAKKPADRQASAEDEKNDEKK